MQVSPEGCPIVYEAQIPLVASHHDTTRYLAIFDTRKSRDVLCRACRTALRDTLVTTSAARVQGHRHSVDWGGHVHLTFSRIVPEIDANPERKILNSSTRPTASSSAMLEQAQRDTHDESDTLVTTRVAPTTRHITIRHMGSVVSWRVVTWRNKWNLSLIQRCFKWCAFTNYLLRVEPTGCITSTE